MGKTRLLATMVAREEKDPKEAMVSMKKLDSMAERVEKDLRVDTMEMMMMIVTMAPREEKDPKEAMVSMKKLEATSVARVGKDPKEDITLEMMMMIVTTAPREERAPKEVMGSMKKLEATLVAKVEREPRRIMLAIDTRNMKSTTIEEIK